MMTPPRPASILVTQMQPVPDQPMPGGAALLRPGIKRRLPWSPCTRMTTVPPPLPIDLLLEIAARTDPVTLVRCAATCQDLRRHIIDSALRPRLRLRHANRFVPSLLRGHLIADQDEEEVYLVDTTDADPTCLIRAKACFPPGPDGKPLRLHETVASHDGLVVVCMDRSPHEEEIQVCNLATGRTETLPPGPMFNGTSYVLIAGGEGGAIGRHFKVLKVNLRVLDSHCFLQFQTYTSEQGRWGPSFSEDVSAPLLFQRGRFQSSCKPLVVGNVVHWLLLFFKGPSYILTLNVDISRATLTTLPTSFSKVYLSLKHYLKQALLATNTSGKRLIVLLAESEKISLWAQSESSGKWQERPKVVIQNEEIVWYTNKGGLMQRRPDALRLEWFAERSGVVLIGTSECGIFWLDLQSMKIVRWFSDSQAITLAVNFPYEMPLSSWAPSFSNTFIERQQPLKRDGVCCLQ